MFFKCTLKEKERQTEHNCFVIEWDVNQNYGMIYIYIYFYF